MSNKQKLELTWIGKEKRPRLEPRILLEDSEKSYHAGHRVAEGDIFNNRLIFGDNLLALKALEHDLSGKIKCIYIDPPFLAEALCKLEGFVYAPSETRWWQHGHSSERDFIYITTQNLSVEHLQALSEEVGGNQSLLICCSAFHGMTAMAAAEHWPNLTLKKIPKMVLARCEWGHDDYSLNVANLPFAAPAPQADSRKKSRKDNDSGDLFGKGESDTP